MSNITDKTRRLLANPRYNILKLWIQCQSPDPRANLISGKCKFLGDGNKMFYENRGVALREKCPNKEFFLARIFPHSDWIRRETEYLSVLSTNAGKCGPEKTPYLDTFHTVWASLTSFFSSLIIWIAVGNPLQKSQRFFQYLILIWYLDNMHPQPT